MGAKQKKFTIAVQLFMEPEMLEWLKNETADVSDVSKYIRKLIKDKMDKKNG